jgi:hypothetical protein
MCAAADADDDDDHGGGAVEGDAVCGLNMRGLMASGLVQAFYPVHDSQRVNDLLRQWVGAWVRERAQPVSSYFFEYRCDLAD